MDPSSRAERLALLASALASLWVTATLPVFAQESYYWSYAQNPDLSYFDHPPMVAWLIWLGTHLLGDGALGIRLGTWLAGVGTTVAGAALLRHFGVGPRGRIAWIVASIGVPAIAAVHFLANPDAPLALFWTTTLLALWRARDGSLLWWLAAGASAGAALLSKYTAAFLAVGGVLVLLLDPRMRRQLRRPGPYLGVLTSVVVFSPVVIWNVQNGFESFRFQTTHRYESAALNLVRFFECLGGQLLMIHPVVALLTPVAIVWLWRRTRGGDLRAFWMLAFSIPLAGYLVVNALWMQVKVNWFTPAYLGLVLGGIVWWSESGWPARHLRFRKLARVAVSAVWVALPLTLVVSAWPAGHGSSWAGWDEIAQRAEVFEEQVDELDDVEGNVFFFGLDYKDSAQLLRNLTLLRSRGGADYNGAEPVLAQNVIGDEALEFDHWTPPQSLLDEDAVLVVARPEARAGKLERVRRVFESVTPVERVKVRRFGRVVLEAQIFVCRRYRGPRAG